MNTPKKQLKNIIAASLLAGASTISMAGFSVSGLELLDGNGNVFTMRGVNHAHTWYTHTTEQALKDIASTNANTVRVVLSNGHRWTKNDADDVASIIRQLKSLNMVAVLEVHDTTGYGEDAQAGSLSNATDYWLSLADVLKGQEDYVIINIGNEPMGNNVPADTWINDHIDAIKRLRNAGFTHTLMVDAPNWGQDWQQIMLNNASTVANADTLKNTLFSVHMYNVYPDLNSVNNYITQFRSSQQLPLVIGEFAGKAIDGSEVAEQAIMSISENLGVGYLGWSWSGNSGTDQAQALDVALNYNLSTLTEWGNTLINSEYGLKNTATMASIFSEADSTGTPGDTTDNNDTDPSDSDENNSNNTGDDTSSSESNSGNNNSGSTDDGSNESSTTPDNEKPNDTSDSNVNVNIGAFSPVLLVLVALFRRKKAIAH